MKTKPETTSTSTRPDYIARGRSKDGKWIRIGAAWMKETSDKKSYISLRLKALPFQFDGTISLFPNEEGER
jgi:uncharacterized protein (DUF736 family)